MKDLQFPFPYREGQRDIVSGVYHTVSSGKTLFVQAPTGVGKTMSAIFPSVRAIGEEKGETLFYRKTGRTGRKRINNDKNNNNTRIKTPEQQLLPGAALAFLLAVPSAFMGLKRQGITF